MGFDALFDANPFPLTAEVRSMTDDDRLVQIESALMELQRHVELLNEALLNQQKDFYAVQSQVKRIESLASEWSESQQSASEERPPHY